MQKELPSLDFQNTGCINMAQERGVRQQGGQPAIDTEAKASVMGRIPIWPSNLYTLSNSLP